MVSEEGRQFVLDFFFFFLKAFLCFLELNMFNDPTHTQLPVVCDEISRVVGSGLSLILSDV